MFLCTEYNKLPAKKPKRNANMSQECYRNELLELMAQHGLKAEDLPDLCEYSRSTVDAWLMPDRTSERARPCPKRAISLMKAKIEAALAKLN